MAESQYRYALKHDRGRPKTGFRTFPVTFFFDLCLIYECFYSTIQREAYAYKDE